MGQPEERFSQSIGLNRSRSTIHRLAPQLSVRDGSRLRCLACARGCSLAPDDVGFCTAIAHTDGQLVSTAYGVVAEANVTPIETKPVYHYRPGARVLSLGGLGCNLRCRFCQNWEVAFRDARTGSDLAHPNLPPEAAVRLALEQGCDGLGWTYNEPSITPMYVLECAQRAREAGLFTVYVTNGMMTFESLSLLGPWLDVYRVDVKSIDPRHYLRIAGTSRVGAILPVATRAQREYGAHVEVVTNLMPSMNDGDEHITHLAARVLASLGADAPLHFTTYVPYALMTHVPPTPPETLTRARVIARQVGLRFVYTDSVAAPETAHTLCDGCGALVVERTKSYVRVVGLSADGACSQCGCVLGMVVAPGRTRMSVSVASAAYGSSS